MVATSTIAGYTSSPEVFCIAGLPRPIMSFLIQYIDVIIIGSALFGFVVFIKLARGSGSKKAIMLACQYGDSDEVKALLKDTRWLAVISDPNGFTPLHVAALWGHDDIVVRLIRLKADINSRNRAGMTPLHGAAMAGHESTVRILLQHNADVNIQDNIGNTPLYLAAWDGHANVSSLLLSFGAELGAVTNKGESALDRAHLSGHQELINILVAEQARQGVGAAP